jgi:hypothetical protein
LGGAACGGPPPDSGAVVDDETDGESDSGWSSLGLGVNYQRQGTGDAVLIAYGGYTAKLSYSRAWASALVAAKLSAHGVGHVYAVKGPKDAGYSAQEIANSALVNHLVGTIADQAPFILVVAHSSGSFVAHELLRQLQNRGLAGVLGKLVYADLDGGGSGLNLTIAKELRRLLFVYAQDPTLSSGLSHNAGTAMTLGQTYSPSGAAFRVSVSGSGCHNKARWCLHDLVITHRPHDPDMYDLADDYTDFAGRPVTTEYLDELSNDLM